MTFGQLIASECRRRGVSRYELAKRLGVTPQRVNNLVRARNLNERTVRECARALGLAVDCRFVKR